MGRRARTVLLLALVMLMPLTAGCNARDWWRAHGTFVVELAPQGAENSSLTEFRSLKIAIYGVSVKQVLVINPHEFSFGTEPLVVDLVEKGTKGERIPLATMNKPIRAVESVTLRLDVVEAVDAQGRNVPVCREGDETTSFPCFFVPLHGAFKLEEPRWAPPRGGTAVFGYPLSVQSVTVEGDTEYFLLHDAEQATIETKR